MEKLYGWISYKYIGSFGFEDTCTYLTPDGEEVVVTLVNEDPNDSKTGWDDIQCIGEVTKCIRSRRNTVLLGCDSWNIEYFRTLAFGNKPHINIDTDRLSTDENLEPKESPENITFDSVRCSTIDLTGWTRDEEMIKYLEKKAQSLLYQGQSSEVNLIRTIIKDLKQGKIK